jgi:hypothetical protein
MAKLQAGTANDEDLGHHVELETIARQLKHPRAHMMKPVPPAEYVGMTPEQREEWHGKNVLGWNTMPETKKMSGRISMHHRAREAAGLDPYGE